MDTFAIYDIPDIDTISQKADPRIKPYLDGWQMKSDYQGTPVNIPGHTNSRWDVMNYFQVIKKDGDPFFREDERDNEISATLWAWWPGYDKEVSIQLFIRGRDVKSGRNKVSAEILKAGGATMKLYWNNKLLTDFTKQVWWSRQPANKIWIDDMNRFR